MLKHNHYDQSTIVEHYNDAAKNYEEVYLTAGYHDPKRVAELTKELVGDDKAGASRILDMGCGTGLVGKYLSELGFKHIDGIDASAGMIENARAKGVYTDLHEMFLGKPETFP
jgi:predicted TPR repeat methyltransferase